MQRYFNNRPMMIMLLVLIILGPGKALLTGGIAGLGSWIMGILLILPSIVVAVSFHEFGHAKAATLCGDNTPFYQGRVSLDPRDHIDLIGLFSFVFIHFGWGRPVEINPFNFRNRRKGQIIVGLAGVFMNLVLAIAFSLVIALIYHFIAPTFFFTDFGSLIFQMLYYGVIMNCMMIFFNLLPVPPLDGFNVFSAVFNLEGTQIHHKIYQNGPLILLIFIVLDIPSILCSAPASLLANFLLTTLFRV